MTLNTWAIVSFILAIVFAVAAFIDVGLSQYAAWGAAAALFIMSIVFKVLRHKAPVVRE
jgi:hypothetical protein